jgi:WD40 repeat protein
MSSKTLAQALGALTVTSCLSLPAGPSEASPPADARAGKWEFKAASFGGSDEIENTRKLNELAAAGWQYVGPLGNGMVAFRRRLELTAKLVRRIEWPDNHVFHTAFSPDSRLYLGGGDTGTLRVWEVASGKQLLELPVPVGLFTPDGKHVLGHKGDKAVSLFDLASGKEVRTWQGDEAVVSLAIAPDGKRLVSADADKALRLRDFATGKELRKMEGHAEPATVAFAPDGKQILSASTDKTVRLWDVETGRLVRTFEEFKDATPQQGHDLIVQAFFLPGGRQVAGYVWGTDRKLLVWDTATGKVLRKLDLGADHHKDVAVSPDGRWLLTGHEDRTVRLRDLTTGKELHRFEMADVNVPRALNFSPDGRFAVAGSHRGWVYLWQLRR